MRADASSTATSPRGRPFSAGASSKGLSFRELVAASPEPLRQAVAGEADTLFTIEGEGESEIYHLSQRGFLLNSQSHRLYLLKQLTRELSRQEVETWKKVIRVIAHELNNSLAPISSLAHSGRQIIERREPGAARTHLPHDRGARQASAYVHRWLCALRQAAAAAARSSRLGGVPALAAGDRAVPAAARAAGAAGRLRSGADGAGADQPGQERAGGGRAAGQHRGAGAASTRAAGGCRCWIAGRACRRRCCAAPCCRSIRPSRRAPGSG